MKSNIRSRPDIPAPSFTFPLPRGCDKSRLAGGVQDLFRFTPAFFARA